jgi:hypothetical protein
MRLRGRTLNSRPYAVTLPAATVGTPVIPPALTGIAFTQASPVHPEARFGATFGYADPIGGVGPYTWGIKDRLNSKYKIDPVTGILAAYSDPLGTTTDIITLFCTDGRGVYLERSFPIAKCDPSAVVCVQNGRPYCFSNFAQTIPATSVRLVDDVLTIVTTETRPDKVIIFYPQCFGGGHSLSDTVTLTDPSGKFTRNTGQINSASFTTVPPIGSYPFTFAFRSGAGDVQNFSFTGEIRPYPPIAYLEFTWNLPISTSTAVGIVLGTACATTPNNIPRWTLDDPTGTLAIHNQTGKVWIKRTPLVAGPMSFSITVSDGLASFTQAFDMSVQAGTTLASTAMSMTVNPALVNAGVGLAVGTPSVSGITGTKTWRILSQTGYFEPATVVTSGVPGNPARYSINPTTGAITNVGILSFQTDTLVVSVSDGLTTCTRSFPVPVAEAPTTTYHIGEGQYALHGSLGFETLAEFIALTMGTHTDKKVCKLYWNADPDYYTNDNGHRTNNSSLRFPMLGPGRIEGVLGPGGELPRVGGYANLNTTFSGGSPGGNYSKGFFTFGDGDWELVNVDVSGVHGTDSIHGVEAFRKEGNSYGNLTVDHALFTITTRASRRATGTARSQ